MTRPALAGLDRAAPLVLEREERGEGWLITIAGELDRSNHRLLVEAVRECDGFVTVDTCEVTFLDSRGLMALIDCRLHVGENQFEICLVEGGPVDRLFTMTGLREDFNLTMGHVAG